MCTCHSWSAAKFDSWQGLGARRGFLALEGESLRFDGGGGNSSISECLKDFRGRLYIFHVASVFARRLILKTNLYRRYLRRNGNFLGRMDFDCLLFGGNSLELG
jgi:hypothetical protein